MLTNRDDPVIAAKIQEEVGRHPSFSRLIDAAASAPDEFQVEADSAGLELAPFDPGQGAATRCRLKLFQPREGKERLCAFFFKRSNLAWSRDRYSYGGVEFRPDQITVDEAAGWLEWLTSGFDPARRPARLRCAFLYDIPD